MKIVLSGGGTGGHAIPLVALSSALRAQAPDLQLHYIGSGAEIEQSVATQANLTYHTIMTGKFRRYGRGLGELTDVKNLHKNVTDSVKFLQGMRQAHQLLRKLQPDAVFVKGGYVGLPVGLAARQLGIPLIIHESDVAMGLTNRILARRAQVIATGFPIEAYSEHIRNKAHFTGNLVRAEFFHHTSPHQGSRTSLLIIGGSSGAQAINEAVWEGLSGLVGLADIIHQTGQHDIAEAHQRQLGLPAKFQSNYHPVAFITQDLIEIMAEASIVITRAGANSIAELAALKKAIIIIPRPNAPANHNVLNAAFIAQHGAARVLQQADLTGQSLNAMVADLLKHPSDRARLGAALGKLARPDATTELAQLILHSIIQRSPHA